MWTHIEVVDECSPSSADGVWISTFTPDELQRPRRRDRARPAAGRRAVRGQGQHRRGRAARPPPACPDFAYCPTGTAPVVRRLLDAGAIVVGKTNLDQFATGLTGARSPYGAPESVFGGGLISGGSSSGSAVAVAAGTGRLRARHRHRRLRPGAGRAQRHRRAQADPRAAQHAGVVPACRSLDCVSVFAPDLADADRVLAGRPAARTRRPVVAAAGQRPRASADAADRRSPERPRLLRRRRPGGGVRRRLRRRRHRSTSGRCSRPATCSTAGRGWPSGWPTWATSSPPTPTRCCR